MEISSTMGFDLWVLSANARKPKLFLQTPFNESAPRFSPDGHWLAYVSNKSGRYEIYVQAYPGPGSKLQISRRTLPTPSTSPNFDVSRDGQRFLMVEAAEPEEQSPTQTNVVFNWFEELKRRVPSGKN